MEIILLASGPQCLNRLWFWREEHTPCGSKLLLGNWESINYEASTCWLNCIVWDSEHVSSAQNVRTSVDGKVHCVDAKNCQRDGTWPILEAPSEFDLPLTLRHHSPDRALWWKIQLFQPSSQAPTNKSQRSKRPRSWTVFVFPTLTESYRPRPLSPVALWDQTMGQQSIRRKCNSLSGQVVEDRVCNLSISSVLPLLFPMSAKKNRCVLHDVSIPQVNLSSRGQLRHHDMSAPSTYWSPIRLQVKRAIRIDSVEPLTEGVPTHDAAAWGITSRRNLKTQWLFR